MSEERKELELKPCPFCGRAPSYTSRKSLREDSHTGELHFIACFCGGNSARAHQFGESYEAVREKWNTRAEGEK